MNERINVNLNTINDELYSLYKKYIDDPLYVYKSCDNYVVIMKLLDDTKTNMDRNNIIDPANATYRADKLYTELIFNKFDLNETVTSISNSIYKKNIITYTINTIVYADMFDNDLNKIYSNGIHFYKRIVRAFLFDIQNKNISFDGEYIEYYDEGQIREKRNYINNELNGDCISYYENLQIDTKCYYVNNKLNNEYISYYENLWLNRILNIYLTRLEKRKNNYDTIMNEFKLYYNNPQIKIKCNYIDNKLCGEYLEYYENENLKMKCNYINDKKCGMCIKYYKHGQIKIQHNYDNDEYVKNYYKEEYNKSKNAKDTIVVISRNENRILKFIINLFKCH